MLIQFILFFEQKNYEIKVKVTKYCYTVKKEGVYTYMCVYIQHIHIFICFNNKMS